MIFELEAFKVFALVLARVSGFVVSAPFLGSGNLPTMAKAGLAALVAMLVTPLVPIQQAPLPNDYLAFAALGASETLTGLAMGFVLTITIAAIQVAGQVIDMLSGFAMVNVFNPALETQTPIFGFFYYILAMLYLLALDGHHIMIERLVHTFSAVPLGTFVLSREMARETAHWGAALFVDGLLIAAPVMSALLLTYVTLGILGRVVPQIHLFVVGFPLTIAMALLLSAMLIQLYLVVVHGMFDRMWGNLDSLIAMMG